ncbi:RNA helicase [Lithospermum erythrorhizon]|uniref:RNA helicase n=1 Tax=Lithospermum erythrorhizon TaxID=34254 RepID=A0AAV3QN94_LITER
MVSAPAVRSSSVVRCSRSNSRSSMALLLPFALGNVNVNQNRNCDFDGIKRKMKRYMFPVVKTSLRGQTDGSSFNCECYRRVPMEPAGAYQLIDDESGEKYIVWGEEGTDVDISQIDATVPSPEKLLSFAPPLPQQESSRGTIASFGRLKAQKVKHIVRKVSNKKQQMDNIKSSDYPAKSLGRSSEMRSQEHTRTPKNSGVSVRRSSDAPTKGWGDGTPTYNRASNQADHSQSVFNLNDKSNFFSRKTFTDLGCNEYVIEALRAQHYPRPSHIQAMSFRSVIEGKSCIIADQSGSGKTLAYLLPLVQTIREEELQGTGKSSPQSPRVIILVPTAELGSQVLSICRSMSKLGVPFRSMVATGGFRQKTQLESLRQEIDVLIATPGRFLYLISEGFLKLTSLKSAVLDEVDILYNDEEFQQAFQCLINSSPVTTQYLFVTATLPVEIYKKLVEEFPDCDVLMGPGMHRTSVGLEEILVDCSGDDKTEKTPDTALENKKNALLRVIEESPVKKSIIFCNKIETCRKVENILKRLDRKGSYTRVLPFHAALDQETRVANINEFRNPQSKNSSLFLVCTDRASRGIDFVGVDHVILFDYPRDPSEYVRRVGRTARGAGGVGKAFIFVVGKQVSLAQRVVDRNRKGHPLHDVPTSFDL